MRIATNMAALSACNQLRRNDNSVAKSLERLSSGYKINSAGDDPVGSAISKKMKMQIRGLERANQNASDGISVVETAEGALQEITSMLQRIRELAVQGATDTSTDDDRTAIMNEISQIEEEIDRLKTEKEEAVRAQDFEKAAKSENVMVATTYLLKLARAYESLNQNDKALATYQTIKSQYKDVLPGIADVDDVDKFINALSK